MATDTVQERMNPRTDESLAHLRRLSSLPPTDRLIERWEDFKKRLAAKDERTARVDRWLGTDDHFLTPAVVAEAEADVALGLERDAVQETRPDGCWCLGLGGRGTAVLRRMAYFEAEDVFSEFCGCPEGQAERDRVREVRSERAEIATRLRLERHWETCGIPKRFRDLRLATSPLKDTMPDLLERITPPVAPDNDGGPNDPEWDAWADRDREWRRSWFLWGKYGTGKTGLAVGYAWEHLNSVGEEIMFRSLPDLLAEIRATYNRPKRKKQPWGEDGDTDDDTTEADLIEKLATVELLVLDDLGAEQVKETGDGSWVADRLFQIVGKRHAEERTTVFTSNLNIGQLAERIGERLAWRIVEMCGKDHIIQVEGRNLRA